MPSSIPFVGTFPPPSHGMSFMTAATADALAASGLCIQRMDVGPSSLTGHRGRLRKCLRAAAAAFDIVRSAPERVLVGADGGKGMLLQIPVVLAAQLRGADVFVFHHSRIIAQERSIVGQLFITACRRHVIQVVLCVRLRQELETRHERVRGDTLVLSNGHAISRERPKSPIGTSQRAGFVVGHMSNLALDKGFGRAADAVKVLLSQGLDVRFVVAGAPSSDDASREIERIRSELGDRAEFLGHVAGVQKQEFFRKIDVFVHPSDHRDECSPIVLLEAMAHSVPVVTVEIGCVDAESIDVAGVALPASASIEELAAAMHSVLRQPERYRDGAERVATREIDRSTTQLALLAERLGGSRGVERSVR